MGVVRKAVRALSLAAVVLGGLGLAAPESRGGEVYVGGYRSGGYRGYGHEHFGQGYGYGYRYGHGYGYGRHGYGYRGYWPVWGRGYRPGYGGVIYNRPGDGIPPVFIPR